MMDSQKAIEKPQFYKFTDRIYKGLAPDSPMIKKTLIPFLNKRTFVNTDLKNYLGSINSSDQTPKQRNDS